MTSRGRVKMEDVARAAGVSVATVSKVVNGRYGGLQRHDRAGLRSHRRPRLRDQPRRPQPAQPQDQRHRRPRRRVRAVQHRAPQGCLGGDRRHRLRAPGLLRRSPGRHRRLGTALPRPPRRLSHRRSHHRHPHRRRGAWRDPGRRHRPAHRPLRRAHGRLRQRRRSDAGHRVPPPPRASPHRAARRPPRPGVRAAARGGLPRAMSAAGVPVDESLVRVGGYRLRDGRGPGPRAAHPAGAPDRGVRRQRPVGHPHHGGGP